MSAERLAHAASAVKKHGLESPAALVAWLDTGPSALDPPTRELISAFRQPAAAAAQLESAIARIPMDLRRLISSNVLSVEQVGALHRAFGITSAADLVEELRRGAIAQVEGIDATAEQALAQALASFRARRPRLPLGQAMSLVRALQERLTRLPGVAWVEPVGSLRRAEETVGDVELLASASDPSVVFDSLADSDVEEVLHRSPRRLYVTLSGKQVGIRCPAPQEAGTRLLHLTGTAAHLNALRRRAAERGWRLDVDGLHINDARTIGDSEEAIYSALELQPIPAEIRYGDGEIAAASDGALPVLLTRSAIRGDLHMHTHWSDGRNSTEEMVRAAVAIGHEYIAITDHSPQSSAARSLTVDGIERQAEEIARLREAYPQITILHGCEVDILPSGALDFTDTILERLDIVLASLHERAGHSPARLFDRYFQAMRHPLVTLLTHPGNRLVPHRAAYDLDYERLFQAAVETGTAVEIDGAPVHLDLDGALARRAAAAGATIVVDSDCHRAEMLDLQMQLGVLTARRGWIQPRHVLNTRPLEDVKAFIAAKRTRA